MGTKWNGLNRNNPPTKTTKETLDRNKEFKKLVLARAQYLFQKYGYIPDEYTGESIRIMSTVPKTGEEGWAHHIDSDRNNLDKSNIFICKYKTHHLVKYCQLKQTASWDTHEPLFHVKSQTLLPSIKILNAELRSR